MSRIIREHIDAAKDAMKQDTGDDIDEDNVKDPRTFGNIYLGSQEKKKSFDAVQKLHSGRQLFAQLQERSKLQIKKLLQRADSPIKAKLEDITSAVAAIDNDSPIVSITLIMFNSVSYRHIQHR